MKARVPAERAGGEEQRTRCGPMGACVGAIRSARAATRTAVFFLKLFPMWNSGLVDAVTRTPVTERVTYRTPRGEVEAELYRPPGPGPHPGILVCLGVVPFGVDHPQVPRLEAALARAGFAALIHWSPSMRDLRLDPRDIGDIAQAYRWLVEQPYVDPARSGLLGTCVGGSFALMAAASPAIRDRVGFVAAFAPYSSMWTFGRDIASGTRSPGMARQPWQVDPLTRKVYVNTLTAWLEPREAQLLSRQFMDNIDHVDVGDLSEDGRAVHALLSGMAADEVQAAFERLPADLRERLSLLSPTRYLGDIHAPLTIIGHDRDDLVIPVDESRRLRAALSGRSGVHYTEFAMFQHMDPTKRNLPPYRLAQELVKFFLYAYPMFRRAVRS